MYNKFVYVAGPLSDGGTLDEYARIENVKVAMEVSLELIKSGIAAFCPHLTYFCEIEFEYSKDMDFRRWMDYCLSIVRRCDALLRLEGHSTGSDEEVETAENIGIPVFYRIEDLLEWAKKEE